MMDNEDNQPDNTAALLAREKRKKLLRDKGSTYSRMRILQQKEEQKKRQQIQTHNCSRTPLSNITNPMLLNQTSEASPFQYTQPTTTQKQARKKCRVINFNAPTINLMDKFAEGSSSNNKENELPNADLGVPLHSSQVFSSEIDFSSDDYTESENDVQEDDDYEEEITIGDAVDQHDRHNNSKTIEGYFDLGDPLIECNYCGALMWYAERSRKYRHSHSPKFELCCGQGRVQIPLLKQPPLYLQHLLFNTVSEDSKHFQQNIRLYNMMFAFTSPGAKIDRSLNNGKGPPTMRIQGQPCHRIGSMLPMEGEKPKFAQLYIYDTDNEIQNRIQGLRCDTNVNQNIVAKLAEMVDAHNSHAKSFRMARDRLKHNPVPNLKLKLISQRVSDGRIYNLPTVSEVAALIVGDVDTAEKRDIIMETRSGHLTRIDELHASYLAYQYPLLFPYGEDGYRHDISHRERENNKRKKRNRLTMSEWFAFRLQTRKCEPQTLLRARRLLQQFLVDGYSMVEADRLKFIRNNQSKLRVDKYRSLNEKDNQDQGASRGKRVILPSSYVGSRRFMDQLYFDGMAICGFLGFPDLFITFTCNPNWPEIKRVLDPLNLQPPDRPDLISRVFKMKFDQLLQDLTKQKLLGNVVAYMYTIEFQKRGLPHAHILLFLHPTSKYPTPEDIDKIISAEIPDPINDKEMYHLVKTHMIHGPCGAANRSSPCMKDGKCSKYFPKSFQDKTSVNEDGYPVYRRRQNGVTVVKNGVTLDNRFVVPHNAKLLLKYQAHINMEWCNQSTSIKYLFKYINKGYDRITAVIEPSEGGSVSTDKNLDEIKQYLDCRYISPCEACWRIFKFQIHGRKPAVERLHFHLPGENSVFFNDNDDIGYVLRKPSVTDSIFTSWMEANKVYPEGKELTYSEFVSKFVYVKNKRAWKIRTKGYTIGRLIWVPPSTGELYYLRMLLNTVKGPTSYEDIRTINNKLHPTFRDACYALGLLKDDEQYIEAIKEAKDWGSGHFLRKLFVMMLLCNTINRPETVWRKTWQWLSDGILYEQRKIVNNRELQLSDDDIMNLTLLKIEDLLQANRKSLKQFPTIPFPKGYQTMHLGNRLIFEEKNYDREKLKEEFEGYLSTLTDEQRRIFDTIMKAVKRQQGEIHFLYGSGGTGKTRMWNTFASGLRSKGHIVLTVASSGIASLLLPGGRTAHSKFKIPVPTLENSICNIEQGSELAELLKVTKLIIWDEAPMCHKYCFEALDKSLRDIMGSDPKSNLPFGGKVIVFGGDFRQILPVIQRGSRSDVVHASLNASYLWNQCKVLKLTKNMRLQQGVDETSRLELANFSKWMLDVGDGKIGEPNDGYAEIEIPDEFLIKDFDDPISTIVNSTYPNLLQHYTNEDFLKARAILASTIEIVDEVNDFVLRTIPGEVREYISCNEIDRSESSSNEACSNVLTPEFLATLRASGLPNHKIQLKVGTPIMLLRNLDQSEGLCNGTRLIVTRMANNVIEAKIISGKNIGNLTYIPRMSMSPSDSQWPFKLIRTQFPIIVSYAMTINKSQGQSLASVGLYLPKPVFSHGQLYVAISRVQSKKGLKILIHDKDKKPLTTTTNVVFKEVFQNL